MIPPGQEDLMASMLGRGEALPGGCRWDGASIEQSRTVAKYRCGDERSEVVIELRHPGAGDGGLRTQKFVLVPVAGTPPGGLLEAIAARIQPREAAWRWSASEAGGSIALRGGEYSAVPPGASWLLPAVVALLVISRIRARARLPRLDLVWVGALFTLALVVRLALGSWGPLQVNGLGGMWLQGAISDPGELYAYGPGYVEVFAWLARLFPASPDVAIFAANAAFSALVPALAYALARLAGLDRARALIPGVILAIDAVSIRVAATESYHPIIISLALVVACAAAAAAWHAERREWGRAMVLALAAGLAAAQAARIHPVAWLPIAIAPVAALSAGSAEAGLRGRLLRAAACVALVGVVVAVASGGIVFEQFAMIRRGDVMKPHGEMISPWPLVVALAAGVAALVWARPRWIVVPALLAVTAAALTRDDFGLSWVWQQAYDRLYLPIPLIAAAAMLRPGWLRGRAPRLVLGAAALALFLAGWRVARARTTGHREYRWFRGAAAAVPADCVIVYLARAGYRNVHLPIFGRPARPPRTGLLLDGRGPIDVGGQLHGADCAYYVHTALCSSDEGRSLCEAIESRLELAPVAHAAFPGIPQTGHLHFDRPRVESALYRVVRVK